MRLAGKSTGDFPRLTVNQRRGRVERRRDVRTGINYVLAVCQALGLA